MQTLVKTQGPRRFYSASGVKGLCVEQKAWIVQISSGSGTTKTSVLQLINKGIARNLSEQVMPHHLLTHPSEYELIPTE